MGGVLIENPWTHTAEAVEEEYGVPRQAVFAELTRLAIELDRDELTLREYHERLISFLKKDLAYTEFESLVLDTTLRRIMPVWEAVADAKRAGRFDVVALSNMSREVWGALEKKYSIRALFTAEVLSFELGVAKPDPRIYEAALEHAAAVPGRSLFVDDMAKNLEAAAEAGIRTYRAVSPEETALFIRSL